MLPDTDTVTVEIEGQIISRVERFELTRDLYSPVGSWSMDIGPEVVTPRGGLVRIYLRGLCAMVGVIGPIDHTYDEKTRTRRISGGSTMGLIARSFITDFSMPPATLKAAAEKYLKDIPHVNRFEIEYDPAALEPNTHHHAADIGDSVFKLLSEYARNRGLIFWGAANGTLVFGKVVTGGEPAFHLDRTNIKKGRMVENSENLHDQVILVSDNEEEGHRKVTVANPSAPLHQPFVSCFNGYSSDLKKQAADYIRQEKMQALQLEYTVRGFGQGARLWDVNEMVQVSDDILCMEGTYVAHRVRFAQDLQSGSTTQIHLGPVLEDPFEAFQRKGRKLRRRGGKF
jgi:prophage tail gpP-like protein